MRTLKQNKLTMEEFFKLIEEMRNQREHILGHIHTFRELAQWATPVVDNGLPVSVSTVTQACKLIGLQLVKRPTTTGRSTNPVTHNSKRRIVAAIRELWKQAMPAEKDFPLEDMYQLLN